jgi:hypothetical protein
VQAVNYRTFSCPGADERKLATDEGRRPAAFNASARAKIKSRIRFFECEADLKRIGVLFSR